MTYAHQGKSCDNQLHTGTLSTYNNRAFIQDATGTTWEVDPATVKAAGNRQIDRIWGMGAEEMAEFIEKYGCQCCAFEPWREKCNKIGCMRGSIAWLESEITP